MNGVSKSRISTVDGATFDAAVLGGQGPVVVEFMSYGCSHCRALEPVIVRVAEAVGARERIVRVNVGVDQDLAALYGVSVTPTLVMFLDGQEVGRVEGPRPLESSLMEIVTRPFADIDART